MHNSYAHWSFAWLSWLRLQFAQVLVFTHSKDRITINVSPFHSHNWTKYSVHFWSLLFHRFPGAVVLSLYLRVHSARRLYWFPPPCHLHSYHTVLALIGTWEDSDRLSLQLQGYNFRVFLLVCSLQDLGLRNIQQILLSTSGFPYGILSGLSLDITYLDLSFCVIVLVFSPPS